MVNPKKSKLGKLATKISNDIYTLYKADCDSDNTITKKHQGKCTGIPIFFTFHHRMPLVVHKNHSLMLDQHFATVKLGFGGPVIPGTPPNF